MVIVAGDKERGKPSEWQVSTVRNTTKPRRPCPEGMANCYPWLWAGAAGKERAYADNHLRFIKNNWRSLQTFLASMQLSGMGGKEAFSQIVRDSNVVAKKSGV